MMKVIILLLCGLTATLATPVENGRIVGGSNAARGQFPYQVSIRSSNNHFCGGSIINENTILTAAHCVYGKPVNGMTVVVGTNKLNTGGDAHGVASLRAHSSYNTTTKWNDIAIVKLQSNIKYTQDVQPVELASYDQLNGTSLILSGWGRTSTGGIIPNDLQYINLKNLDLSTCAWLLQGTAPISTGHVCTTSPVNQGACNGDSGGPLVNKGVQVGIVSWGIPCAKGRPDVFTSVAFYRFWIYQNS